MVSVLGTTVGGERHRCPMTKVGLLVLVLARRENTLELSWGVMEASAYAARC
jgi:hypothetical protein